MSCGSSHADPARAVPDLGQLTEDDFEPSRPDIRDVLQEEDSRSYDANCFEDVDPNSRASTSNSNPVPRNADVLAGKACGDYVHLADELTPVDFLDVPKIRGVRVSLSEDGARAWGTLRDVRDSPAYQGSDSHSKTAVPGTQFEDLQADPLRERRTCVNASSFRRPL